MWARRYQMIQVKRIDHVAIAVPEMARAKASLARLFGLVATPDETIAAQKVVAAFMQFEGAGQAADPDRTPQARLELVAPDGNPSLERFLEKRGSALHHVCFEVEDLPAALSALAADGVELIDREPRRGAQGHWVAFIHPRSTGGILFELCQKETQKETR